MAEQLLIDLVQAARDTQDAEVMVIVTPKAENAPTRFGKIDIGQSNSKILSLLPVDTSQPAPKGGPTYRFLRGCVRQVASAGALDGEPLYWFIINSNHSMTGVRITSEEYYKLNDKQNGGSWPAGFTHDDPNIYVYLKSVTFDGAPVTGAVTFGMDEINCCGERG